MPVERHEQDQDQEIAQLRAEVAMLRARLADIVRLLAAQQEAAPQIREDGRAEGWRAGFDEGRKWQSDEAPPPPRARHLRVVGVAVPAFTVAGRVLRHKAALAVPAAAALLVVAAPAMNLAPWIAPAPHPAASPVTVSPAGWGPSGTRGPHPSPGGHGHSPHPTPPGHARSSPAPDPEPSPGDTTSPADTESPSPSGTPQHSHACTPPPS